MPRLGLLGGQLLRPFLAFLSCVGPMSCQFFFVFLVKRVFPLTAQPFENQPAHSKAQGREEDENPQKSRANAGWAEHERPKGCCPNSDWNETTRANRGRDPKELLHCDRMQYMFLVLRARNHRGWRRRWRSQNL